MRVMSVEKFLDRDDDYLSWVEEHRTGYVVNVGWSGRGYARMHHAACPTITSRPIYWPVHQDLLNLARRTRSVGSAQQRHRRRALRDVPATRAHRPQPASRTS